MTACAVSAFAETKLYENNFEQAALDKAPDDFLVLDGDFAVKQDNGNKVLELPGAPLDTFGVLFGPTTNSQRLPLSARIYLEPGKAAAIRPSASGHSRRAQRLQIESFTSKKRAGNIQGRRIRRKCADLRLEIRDMDNVPAPSPAH